MKLPERWLRRLLRLAGELLVVVMVLLAAERWMTRDVERGVALQLAATTLDGKPFDLQQWRGKGGIIYFWAEWCSVCRANRHVITSLAVDEPVMSVAMQSGSDAEVNAYLKKEQITFPVINDQNGELSRHFHVNGVPFALIVDSSGRVRYVVRGYTTELGLRARLWLAS